MLRHNEYTQLRERIQSVKKHAQEKGDAVLADKARKMEVNVNRLEKNDSTPIDREHNP